MRKRIFSIFLALTLLTGGLVTSASDALAASSENYGLTVSGDGTLLLNGEAYYGFGTCLYSSFNYYYDHPLDARFEDEFAMMVKYNIGFVRTPFCGYSASYYDQFDADPEAALQMMSDVVAAAEKNHIGIIVSLLWLDSAVSEHVGEQRSDMGNPDSQTVAYAKNYVATVVQRFKDSPAIWGWEVGNEYNLTADLCDSDYKNYLPSGKTTGNGFDYYTSEELQTFYAEIGKEIRKYDSYRMISNGNGEMRNAAYHMNQASQKTMTSNHLWSIDWTQDSLNQFQTMCQYFTPDPVDTLSVHFQHGTLNSSNPSYVLTHSFAGKTVSTFEYLKAYVAAAKKMNKALYYGEFGDFMDMETADDCAQKFNDLCGWIVDSGIQMASSWQFSGKLYAVEDGIDGQKLSIMSQYNLQLQSEGKQNSSAYWASVSSVTADTSADVAANTTGSVKGDSGSATTSSSTNTTAKDAAAAESAAKISSYMVSCSTKLTIAADTNEIVIQEPVTLDVFKRSIVLKDGYTMEVADLTDLTAMVEGGAKVTVYCDKELVNTFTVRVEATTEVTATGTTTGGDSEGSAGSFPWVIVIVLSVIVLAGAGAAVYFLVIRKKKS